MSTASSPAPRWGPPFRTWQGGRPHTPRSWPKARPPAPTEDVAPSPTDEQEPFQPPSTLRALQNSLNSRLTLHQLSRCDSWPRATKLNFTHHPASGHPPDRASSAARLRAPFAQHRLASGPPPVIAPPITSEKAGGRPPRRSASCVGCAPNTHGWSLPQRRAGRDARRTAPRDIVG